MKIAQDISLKKVNVLFFEFLELLSLLLLLNRIILLYGMLEYLVDLYLLRFDFRFNFDFGYNVWHRLFYYRFWLSDWFVFGNRIDWSRLRFKNQNDGVLH